MIVVRVWCGWLLIGSRTDPSERDSLEKNVSARSARRRLRMNGVRI